MAKISQVSSKYIIRGTIDIEGVVDKPDIIGAVFGQTEGLLGNDLELRELQRSGRIGRIEVNVESKQGKTTGEIIVSSSLDKSETAIIGAAFEIIDRIGPCNAKIHIQKIEDVRISKRNLVVSRAKELLKDLMDSSMPDSQEITDEVAYSVRAMEITTYGKDKLPAGPHVEDSEEIILVEGRADVITLLKNGFKNAIAMNGTSVPETIKEISKHKIVTAFVDGDRGGDLNIQELLQVAELDFVCKAPDGKEVEELTSKELHKALRGKVAAEQWKLEHTMSGSKSSSDRSRNTRTPVRSREDTRKRNERSDRNDRNERTSRAAPAPRKPRVSASEKESFQEMIGSLLGSKGAAIMDKDLKVLGKIPLTELQSTLSSMKDGIHAVVLDGAVSDDIVSTAERSKVKFVVGMENSSKGSTRLAILTTDDLE